MMRPPKGLGLCALSLFFLALSLLPRAARAADEDTGDSSDAPSAVPVHIRSIPEGESAEVVTFVGRKKAGEVVVQCSEDCDRMVPPGMYRVRLYNASGHEVGSTRVSLTWPTTFRASAPESRSLATWGLGMGIVGSVVGGVAGGLLMVSVLAGGFADGPAPTSGQEQSQRQYLTALGITTLAGLGLAVTGGVLFASNHSVFHTSTDYPWGRRVSFGVAPADHGLMTGVTALF
jgi:hypothetical protein